MNIRISRVLAAAPFILGFVTQGQAAAASNFSVLWAFAGLIAGDGTAPHAPLILDEHGNLYGTTGGGGDKAPNLSRGTVFELTPPARGQTQWSEKLLWTLSGPPDGAAPEAGLITDAHGNFYGTTSAGGSANHGVVFELTPPARGETQWSEELLWSFSGGADGGSPAGSLVMDNRGNLYGATSGGGIGYGAVFQLTPPARGQTQWGEQVLWTFSGGSDGNFPGSGGLLLDRHGNLYGTTEFGGNGCGVAFELIPPRREGAPWRQHVLWSFTCGLDGAEPLAGLIMDQRGNLYGTTTGGGAGNNGVVFELTPPAIGESRWSERVLWSFTGGAGGSAPAANLLLDMYGNLYGTTVLGGAVYDSGTVFELMPPAHGETQWSLRILHPLADDRDGASPYAGLIADLHGNLYGTAAAGGPNGGGTVFEVTP